MPERKIQPVTDGVDKNIIIISQKRRWFTVYLLDKKKHCI